MLQHVPRWLAALLRNVRVGHDKLLIVQPELGIGDRFIALSSPAFAHGGRLRFTADGDGVSPPLIWDDPPEGASSLALLVLWAGQHLCVSKRCWDSAQY